MLVAVEETATGAGKKSGQTRAHSASSRVLFTLRQLAFAALALAMPALSSAQIAGGGAHAPNVIQTPNGIEQVNINRPSGAGVSVNTYNRFDVQQRGAILNNSPTMVQSQLGGMINGNPNFAPGQAAKVIVNQVNSASASQFNGALEVAGQRANVILANPSGISVNGGTFINTSRATLTTGTPNYAADGSLSGFNVTGGNITVSGAGLNASDVDQVDLLSRAVQANAAVYAKTNLNVVTGANHIDYNSLDTAAIAGDGPAPGVSIDVSNLGGMYANRIVLVGTEAGVGISLKGITAAQSGDLVLTSAGRLVLAGQTNASGNIVASAQDIDSSGTTYAQQNANLSASGALTNSGMIAAQQNTSANAGSVNSTGTLAAGVNGDGSLAQTGDLNVSASGAITATGRNVAGGNASVSGASVDLAGATNSANGALILSANNGDLNLSGAATTAGGTLDARAAGTLTNDNGAMSSGSAQTLTASALSNRAGQIVSGSTLTENVAGATNNQGGTMQAAGALASSSASLDNSDGHVASLNADGVSLTTTGLLNNGAGGTIGGNGAVNVQAGQIANAGSVTAVQSLIARAVQTLFNSGTFATNGDMTLSAGSTLTNAGQFGAARALTLSAATFDNSGGASSASQFVLHASNLMNRGGTLTQTGTGAMTLDVTGTLDNSAGGTLQRRAKPWTFVASVDNSGTESTGKWQGNVSLGIDNPLGLNDIFTVGANQDLSFGNKALGSHGFNGSYSIPFGYWTATLSGNTNTYYQNIAGVNETFVSSGNSQTAALRIARVLSRSQNDVLGGYVQLSKRFGDSFIDDTTIPTQARNNTFLELGATDRHYFGAAQFDGTLAYRQGIGGLGATPDPYIDGPTYRFQMAVLDANLSVPFAIANQPFRYVTTFHGQFTNDTLFYIDDLTIGSRYTVRGFDGETMLAAERGFYWRNELQWPVFQTGQTLYAGIDYGRVFGPNTAALAGTQLAGAVIGIRGGVPTKVVGVSYDLFAGTPIYKPKNFPTARWTVGFQLTAAF
ncbi:ShlB/FhaC/HecB family hemolysin secretion/activation protein [Paraburkholderia tropica]